MVNFPSAGPAVMSIIGFLLFLAVAGPLVTVTLRSRISKSKRKQSNWAAIEKILAEHHFAPSTTATINALLKRHAGDDPLAALTTREGFERCVDREIHGLIQAKDQEALELAGSILRLVRTELGLDLTPVGQQIHSSRELYHSQWVEVAQDTAKPLIWYRFMIEDVDEAFLYISFRRDGDQPIPRFKLGETVRCQLWRDEDAGYMFKTIVAIDDGPPPTWRLLHSGSMKRNQQREHYRIHHEQEVVVNVLNSPSGDEAIPANTAPVTRLRGRLTSLSAGGCALVVHQPITRQVVLRVGVEIPGKADPISVDLQIVSTANISGGRVLVRGNFVHLDDANRDEIAKYILKVQQAKIAESS